MNHKRADAELDFYEMLCHAVPKILNASDAEIAVLCEQMFDIPAAKVLEQFNRPDASDHSTVELVMMAHDPGFFDNANMATQ